MKKNLILLLTVPFLCSCTMEYLSEDVTGIYSDMAASALFPDPVFAEFCQNAFDGSIDGVKDGILQVEEIQYVKAIDCSGLGINDLSGIKVFISLETLVCKDNKLTFLDMDQLPNLRYLDCSGNIISQLNVSKSNLTDLFCYPMIDPGTGRNSLEYLYVRRGQGLPFITSDRDKADLKRIPDETMVIAIPESKGESEL